ncbi:MAG TPA: SIR2 family protein [Pyrinomonadaceae bacterium]|jgi:hypothetical protein|nr:SIR2 family protein [Pyrinomonadaceae bacterium]
MAAFDDIVEAIKAGGCILFLGAGVHYPPKDNDPVYGGCYPASEQPPLGRGLADILAADCKFLDDPDFSQGEKESISSNLQRISLYYEINKSRPDLTAAVRKAVSDDKQPSRAVRALAELDFPIICTTNYDKLFEIALFKANKLPVVASYSRDKFAITQDYKSAMLNPRKPFLFKIHGDIDDASDSMVITDEDYIHFILRMINGKGQNDPIPKAFRYYVSLLPILFVGFSLMDYNLRLLFKILGWEIENPKQSYSIGPYPDGLIKQKYDPPVKFIAQDVWKFVPELYQAVKGVPMP